MKRVVLASILSVSFCFLAVSQNVQSFEKYSYLLVLMNGKDTIGNASGFFVEKCNRLFLVSNFHVLANKEYNTLQPLVHNNKVISWNRILIRYNKNSNGKWMFYNLELSSVWKNTDKIPKVLAADIWAQEIDDIDKKTLNIVDINNDAIHNNDIQNGGDAFVFGYPKKDYNYERDYNNRIPRLIESKLIQYDNKKLDGKNIVFELSRPIEEGYSGSPVFAYYKKRGLPAIKFLGIAFASGGKDLNDLHCLGFRSDVVDKFVPTCNAYY